VSLFDEASARPPGRPDATPFSVPPWLGPPQEQIGGTVGLQGFLVQTPTLVIALTSATAFTAGCAFDIVWSARRGDHNDEQWAHRQRAIDQHHQMLRRPGAATDGALRFGIQLADGRNITTTGVPGPGRNNLATPPRHPVLLDLSGSGSGSQDGWTQQVRLWLWPLPPPGAVALTCTWPAADVALTHISLDANALLAAAARAQPLWP